MKKGTEKRRNLEEKKKRRTIAFDQRQGYTPYVSSDCISNGYEEDFLIFRLLYGPKLTSTHFVKRIIIFLKPLELTDAGLPQSMSEGRLQRTFSQFGEVSQVKMIMDTKSRQPLGFAYIWFTTQDSAELAVKEMNGKFFDGRFVFVTIAKRAPYKSRKRP